PRRITATYLERDLPCQLEHLPVEEEEAGQPQLVDQRQLALETCQRLRPQSLTAAAVTLRERMRTHFGEQPNRGIGAVREVGVAVAELLREVEREHLCDGGRPLGGGPVDAREVLDHLARRAEEALAVPAPLLLAAVEGRAAADGDEHVLEQRARTVVGV